MERLIKYDSEIAKEMLRHYGHIEDDLWQIQKEKSDLIDIICGELIKLAEGDEHSITTVFGSLNKINEVKRSEILIKNIINKIQYIVRVIAKIEKFEKYLTCEETETLIQDTRWEYANSIEELDILAPYIDENYKKDMLEHIRQIQKLNEMLKNK